MSALRRFAAVMVADLRERTRSTRFWVILGLMGLLSWLCFPPLASHYVTVNLGDNARGVYSSAWMGMTLGLMYATTFSLFGFYLVRGTLARDFDTRVWQLVVVTPMTRGGYLLAKWASHLAVFSLISAVGIGVALVAQLVRAEDRHVDLIELVKPVLLLSLPSLAVTAFFAVLFDLVPWLRRTGGNVLYFFLWICLFTLAVTLLNPEKVEWMRHSWFSDPNGIAMVTRDLQSQLASRTPGLDISTLSVGVRIIDSQPLTFHWLHWQVSPLDVLGRLLWVVVPMALVFTLAPWLDRAAARTSTSHADRQAGPGRSLRWIEPPLRALQRLPNGILLAAEMRLVLRQRRFWWWPLMLGLWIAQALSPPTVVVVLAIIALVASVDAFARAILRERETGTGALAIAAAGAARKIVYARVGVASLLAVGSVLPGVLHLLAVNSTAAAALLLVACNVGIGGLAVGALCQNPRPFELLLLSLAYIGVQAHGPMAVLAYPGWALGVNAIGLPLLLAVLLLTWPMLVKTR
ncbi:MAG: hypothetical protein ABI588_05920 [Arenimonas sp.]